MRCLEYVSSFCLAVCAVLAVDVAPAAPLDSYEDVEDIQALADALQKQTADAPRHSFSRDWFDWELLLRRTIDEGYRDPNALKVLQAYFRGAILDRYRVLEAKGEADLFYIFNTSAPDDKALQEFDGRKLIRDVHGGGGHGGWGAHARMLIYEELVRQNLLVPKELSLFRNIVIQSLSTQFLDFNQLERGANNRPYKNTGGLAAALRLFPDMPRAEELQLWIERQWREFTDYGDIFEINHFPYGGLHLTGLLDIAEETGKINQPDDRRLIEAVARRYLRFNHGMGVRGNPNSGATVNTDIAAVFKNPWHVAYYSDILVPDFWYRMAQEFRDPEFLWAAVQTSIGPEPPSGNDLEAMQEEWRRAYTRRFAWFAARGMEPRSPQTTSSISLLSPTKYRIPERLYLCAAPQENAPFVSFYLYDRNNEYMHCFGDAMGHLYEYCVDGAKLLGTSGKYNGIFWGQAYYDMLMVRHPADEFPMHAPIPGQNWDAFLEHKANVWRTASCSLPEVGHSRTGPDSANWVYEPEFPGMKWRRADDPVGRSAANMDGLVYLNNRYTLNSVTLRLNGAPAGSDGEAPQERETILLRRLRLGGPKGDILLCDFDTIHQGLHIVRRETSDTDWSQLSDTELGMVAEIIRQEGTESCQLKVIAEPGHEYAVRVSGLNRTFDVAQDYTRISFDYRATSTHPFMRHRQGWRYGQTRSPALVGDMILNDRTEIPSHDVRGGILETQLLRAENQGQDSFGAITYRNYFGAHSTWTRQTVLTEEGYLVVRDAYVPGQDTDGYRVGPIWCLRADGTWKELPDPGKPKGYGEFEAAPVSHSRERHWFDAPAWDHAWWQHQKKRVLVYFHPTADQTCGQLQHDTTPDISRTLKTNSTWSCSVVEAGHPEVFLTILLAFNGDEDAASIAAGITTHVDSLGNVTATVRGTQVQIEATGAWRVSR